MKKIFQKENFVPTPPGGAPESLESKKFRGKILKVGRLHENGTTFCQFISTQVLFIEMGAKSFLCLWIRASFGLITLLVPMEGYLHYGCYTLASHGFVPIVRHVIVTTKELQSICTYHSAGVFPCLPLSSPVFVPTDK